MARKQSITAEQLQPFRAAGVVAAAKQLHRCTRTINRAARRAGFRFDTCTETERYHRERRRKELAPKIRALAQKRMSQAEMCAALGITRECLRRTAREHDININRFSLF